MQKKWSGMRFWELWPGRIYCFSLEKQMDVPYLDLAWGLSPPFGTDTWFAWLDWEAPMNRPHTLSLLRTFLGICCQTSFAWCKPKSEGSDWLMWPTSDHTVTPLGSPWVLGLSVHSSLEDKQKSPACAGECSICAHSRQASSRFPEISPARLTWLSQWCSVSHLCWSTGLKPWELESLVFTPSSYP